MSVDSLSASSSGIPGQKRPAAVWGYAAGIITGVTYGLNPLFAVPLIRQGISVDTILLFRYLLAVVILGGWLAVRKENFRVSRKQVSRLVLLGLLFSMSSLTLFEAYNYIPSGVATTIVFLYPVLVAIIMVFMRVYPTWQVWLAIVMTFVGVLFLCRMSLTVAGSRCRCSRCSPRCLPAPDGCVSQAVSSRRLPADRALWHSRQESG